MGLRVGLVEPVSEQRVPGRGGAEPGTGRLLGPLLATQGPQRTAARPSGRHPSEHSRQTTFLPGPSAGQIMIRNV